MLHVAWHKGGDLSTPPIGPTASSAHVAGRHGWASTSDPALVAVPGRAAGDLGRDPHDRGRPRPTRTSTPRSPPTAARRGRCSPARSSRSARRPTRRDTSATTLPERHTLQTWPGRPAHGCTRASTRRRRTSTSRPRRLRQRHNLASDASGGGDAGLVLRHSRPASSPRPSAPTARPAGAPLTMPGTQVMVGGPELSRTPIVARPKSGGFYVARGVGYPTANRVRVWRVGAPSATLLAKTAASAETAISADAKGRLWVAWTDGTFGDEHVYVARSNAAAIALRRAGRRRRGQGRALGLLARHSARPAPARRRAGGLRRRRPGRLRDLRHARAARA